MGARHPEFDLSDSSARWGDNLEAVNIVYGGGIVPTPIERYMIRVLRQARRQLDPVADADLIAAVGMFNEPAWPDVDGLDAFAGTVMHSARWDPGVRLDGLRVGVVGSAASAVQLVPEVAKVAGHLTVFQRSPNWVLPKQDTPWTAEEIEAFRAAPPTLSRSSGGRSSTRSTARSPSPTRRCWSSRRRPGCGPSTWSTTRTSVAS